VDRGDSVVVQVQDQQVVQVVDCCGWHRKQSVLGQVQLRQFVSWNESTVLQSEVACVETTPHKIKTRVDVFRRVREIVKNGYSRRHARLSVRLSSHGTTGLPLGGF
jgi:hypothetical protein